MNDDINTAAATAAAAVADIIAAATTFFEATNDRKMFALTFSDYRVLVERELHDMGCDFEDAYDTEPKLVGAAVARGYANHATFEDTALDIFKISDPERYAEEMEE